MQFMNKKNKTVLTPVKGEYLIKFKEGYEGEKQVRNLSEIERFKHSKWIPKDNLLIFTFDEQAEKTHTMSEILDELNEDQTVEAVIPVFEDEEGFRRLVVPNRLLVAYHPGLKDALIDKLAGTYSIAEQSRFGNWLILELPEGVELTSASENLEDIPEIDYIEPVYYGVNDAEEISTNDVRWNLNSININDAWTITKGNPEILIAVIDGKPDISHPSLKQSFQQGLSDDWDFADNSIFSSHSTQILSILTGQRDDLQGISPLSRIISLSVNLNAQYYHQRAEAIYYLKSIMEARLLDVQPVKRVVANCSWKTSGDVRIIREAIQEAAAAGVIFVTSAGNENTSGAHYPSDYSKTINGVFSVAALAPSGRKADYSNYSPAVTISAPGGAGQPFDDDDIYCADLNNSTAFVAGTSFAAPHVAGVIALMLSVNPALDIESISDILVRTAVPISEQNPGNWQYLGAGKLDAGKAMDEIRKNNEIITEPTDTDIPDQHGGPKINITIADDTFDNIDTDLFAKEICNRACMEINQLSGNWVLGSNVRITINDSNGSSVILNYTI